jgi:Glycosyl transferase family 2
VTPITASLIVRDAAATIEPCIASIRPHVDEVCIQAVGSRVETLETLEQIAAKPGAPVRVEHVEPCDHYAEARMRALEMCSHDWVLSLDPDDLLMGGRSLRGNLGIAAQKGKTCLVLAWNAYDDPAPIILPRIALVRRGTGRWMGSVQGRWIPDDPHSQHWVLDGSGYRYDLDEGKMRLALAEPWIHHLRRSWWGAREGYEEPLIAALDDEETPQAWLALAELRAGQERWDEAAGFAEGYLATGGLPDPYFIGSLTALAILATAHEKSGDEHAALEAWSRRKAAVAEYVRLPALPPQLADSLRDPLGYARRQAAADLERRLSLDLGSLGSLAAPLTAAELSNLGA